MGDYEYITYNNIKIYYKIKDIECYPPKEDSFLLNNHIKEFSLNKKILDMGCGSGIQGLEAYKYSKNISFADVSKDCIKISKINFYINYINQNIDIEYLYNNIDNIKFPVNFIVSDLFSNINDKYDLIFFNPPYLPEVENEEMEVRRWVSGGRNGYETINRFLYQSINKLNKFGEILIIMSSINNPSTILNSYQRFFNYKIIDNIHIFFEDLYLIFLKRKF
ncbi:putative S-adenosylmethionine-dependent methyltransferase [Nanobdella aerobiophila]|uniref:S-adenosylmethionine-dependent methyltransferase n=1 Tax=Nanobdella aerobiophila TaxID=2586965 RepID=A0A915SCV0_9ARCH|nr:HemK2/MTQ2 family protein methyltransferase [Nanobdella aerobiophila]BBL45688.1 putative S-adenosylmethionine-dependent methyltransferase [Nanobdella aerobiophila]